MKRTRRQLKVALIVATCFLTLLASRPAHAVVLLYEGFDSGYTAGSVNGQAYRGSGLNPGGAWNTTASFVAGGLEFPGLQTTPGFHVVRNNGDMIGVIDRTGGGPFAAAGLVGPNGNVGDTSISGTLYFSFLGRDVDGDGTSWAGFNLYNGGSEHVGLGNPGGPDNYGIYHNANGEPDIGNPPTLIDDQTHFFVVRADFGANGADSYTAWLDPIPGLAENLQNPNIASPTVTTIAAENDWGFSEFHMRGDDGAGVWEFDEIRFGTTWEDVTSIPEPATGLLALVGVGLGAFLLRRRRRRRR